MRFPSKVTTFNESIMAKFPLVLKELENYNLSPSDLYSRIKKNKWYSRICGDNSLFVFAQ